MIKMCIIYYLCTIKTLKLFFADLVCYYCGIYNCYKYNTQFADTNE